MGVYNRSGGVRLFSILVIILAAGFACPEDAPLPAVAVPEGTPLPPDVRDLEMSTTPNSLNLRFSCGWGLAELRNVMDDAFKEHGWSAEWLDLPSIPVIDATASKGARTLRFAASAGVLNELESCLMWIIDSSVERCAPEAADEANAQQAARVLESMRTRYREAETYQDRGVERTEFRNTGTHDFEKAERFTTAFLRPNRYRYEVVDERDSVNIVYQSGSDIRGYASVLRRSDVAPDLSYAAAGADGPVDLIARLLGIMEGDDITQTLREPHLLDEESIAGTPCYVVEGYDDPCMLVRLWIGKDDYLLRQTESSLLVGSMRTRTVITIEPLVNTALPDKALAYNKPQRAVRNRIGSLLEWVGGFF